jgi:cytidylate kinase
MLLQRGLLPRDHQHAVLLVADADFLDASLRPRLTRKCCDRSTKRKFQEFTTLHSDLLTRNATARDHSVRE